VDRQIRPLALGLEPRVTPVRGSAPDPGRWARPPSASRTTSRFAGPAVRDRSRRTRASQRAQRDPGSAPSVPAWSWRARSTVPCRSRHRPPARSCRPSSAIRGCSCAPTWWPCAPPASAASVGGCRPHAACLSGLSCAAGAG
jgi:hypothetical protein